MRALRLGGRVVVTASALALGACHAPDQISLGGATPPVVLVSSTVYLSPTGSDDNPGTTSDRPWKTFAYALPRLGPGAQLLLLDGIYDGGTTGFFEARCGVDATNGADADPIVVSAANPRGAFLRGDASGPPFYIEGCSNWTIQDLRIESDDFASTPDTPDAGSVVVLGPNNHNVKLRRLLARRPNRYKHSHVIRIGDGSSDVLVEECELYDFHHNAVEMARTSRVELRRNYVNSRGTPDLIPGGYVSEDATEGDYGFFLEETRDALLENNVIEGVHDGIGVVGRDPSLSATDPPPVEDPLDGNELLGNVVVDPAGVGVRLDGRCLMENPCVEPARRVQGTTLVDDVVVGGAAGLSSAGAVGTMVRRVSVLGAANGLLFVKEPQNVGVTSTSMTSNTLALVQAEAFRADGETMWTFDHCAASSGSGVVSNYVPDDGHVTSKVAPPGPTDLGGCLVYLPAGSALRTAGAGGDQVGADVRFRYEGGLLPASPQPLWVAQGGGRPMFPCGAIVPGINDVAATSCGGVQDRLHVDAADCPLP